MFFRGFLFGIAGSTGFGTWAWPCIVGGSIAVSAIVYTALRHRTVSWKYSRIVGGTLLGCGIVLVHQYSVYPSGMFTDGDILTGHILDMVKPNTYLVTLDDEKEKSRSVLLTIRQSFEAGDVVRFTVQSTVKAVQPPLHTWSVSIPGVITGVFDYPTRLYMKGYTAHIYGKQEVFVEIKNLPFLLRQRHTIKTMLGRSISSQDTRALVTGMLIGGRAELSQELYDRFIHSGLVHMLVVSGGNIMMVTVLLGTLFFFVPLYGRIVLLTIGIIVYALMCGGDSSVLRALCMGCLTLVGIMLGRSISLGRVLQITVVSLLIRNPYFLMYDLGFLLSFAAVLGMVGLHRCLECCRHALPRRLFQGVANYVAPCVGASLGVLPVLLFSTGSMNMTGIGINILLGPLVPVVLLLGGAVLIVPYTWTHRPVRLLELLTSWFFAGAQRAETYSRGVTLTSQFSKLLVSGCVILIYYVIYEYLYQRNDGI